jgi:multidrug efflux pump subunit AcrB
LVLPNRPPRHAIGWLAADLEEPLIVAAAITGPASGFSERSQRASVGISEPTATGVILMLKFLGSTVGIIFLIGLLVVIGLFMLVF